MFVPPEHRQPGPPPWRPTPPRRALTKRGENAVIWMVCIGLLLMLLAPIGGATVVQALWFLLKR